MKVTIVGGGNIGTQFAVHCAEKGHEVKIFTSKPELFAKKLKIVNENDDVIREAEIVLATNQEAEAFGEAELIFVTLPAYCMKDIANSMLPYIKQGTMIGLIPGTGGGECVFKACVEKGAVVFGLQRVPSVARLKRYGEVVCATGYRDELFLAAIPNKYTKECSELITNIFDMKCIALPNYLNVTLTPSNPILHTTRLKSLFEDYYEGKSYVYVPLFYEEWDDKSSELLLKCDDEVQKLCEKMDMIDLSYVKSLRTHYESETAEKLTQKLRSIKSLQGLKTPTAGTEKALLPDFSSRYFIADFSYGLTIIEQIAEFVQLDVPYIKETMNWYRSLITEREEFQYKDYGIMNSEQFKQYYI